MIVLDQLAPLIGSNSLKAIPLILLLAFLQRCALRWITPQGMQLLWFLAVARLFLPDFSFSLQNVHGWPSLLPARLLDLPLSSLTTTTADAASGRVNRPLAWINLPVLLTAVWIAGVVLVLGDLIRKSWNFHQRFAGRRPCTDSALLNLLEDVKEEAGLRVPVSLVVSESIAAPALYGFIRPRLLLPAQLVQSLDRSQLRYIFQHEMAHVSGWDIVINWFMSLTLAVHWFNPCVWVMARLVARNRELACDRVVLAREKNAHLYGEVILRVAETLISPQTTAGMVGIVENKNALKERIEMMAQPHRKTGWIALTALTFALGALALSNPLQADATSDSATTASIQTASAWLPLIDAGKYADSYDGFCVVGKTALTRETWARKSQQVRDPLGKLVSRNLKTKEYLTALPSGASGQFVLLQYETEYQNLKATETVTTMLDKDGQWRIAGYYIRPR